MILVILICIQTCKDWTNLDLKTGTDGTFVFKIPTLTNNRPFPIDVMVSSGADSTTRVQAVTK